MMKRTLSFLLCLAMLLSFGAPTVQAAESNAVFSEDEVYIDELSDLSHWEEGDFTDAAVKWEEPEASFDDFGDWDAFPPEVLDIPSVKPEPSRPTVVMPDMDHVGSEPIEDLQQVIRCGCGKDDAAMEVHADHCLLKQYYARISQGTAQELYRFYLEADDTAWECVVQFLEAAYPYKLAEVQKQIDATAPDTDDETEENAFSGTASGVYGDVTVDAQGVPEGSALSVQQPSAEAVAAVQEYVADADLSEQLFLCDISVQNRLSSDWQPENGAVELALSVQNSDLPEHTQVKIVHVDDSGNVSEQSARVGEDGQILFETEGFSTFAGYIVDFTYDTAVYSMDGQSEVYLSQVFDALQMPLDAANAASVSFSDTTLLSVEQTTDDWKLTSLQAISTQQTLTVTMSSGDVYEIIVTGRTVTAHTWTANADGTGAALISNKVTLSGGTHSITIVPEATADTTAETLHINLYQLYITTGAQVTLSLDADAFAAYTSLKEVILHATDNEYMVDLRTIGSLKLEGLSHCPLVLSGADIDGNTLCNTSLIRLYEATTLEVRYATFRHAPVRAIYAYGDNLEAIRVSNTTFESTCSTTSSNGGAVYVAPKYTPSGSDTKYTYLNEVTITDSVFNGNSAPRHGGAVCLYGRINTATITGCTFSGTKSENDSNAHYGGAVAFFGLYETITIDGTFENCSASGYGGSVAILASAEEVSVGGSFTGSSSGKNGGAVYLASIKASTSDFGITGACYNRIKTLKFMKPVFTNCTANSWGGAVSMGVQVSEVIIRGATFTGCSAPTARGGALVFNYNTMDEGYTWFDSENADEALRDEVNTYWTNPRTTFGSITIEDYTDGETTVHTTFQNCSATTYGGAIAFCDYSCADSFSMSNVTITGCQSVTGGSAVYLGIIVVPQVDITGCTISGCTVSDSSYGGTVYAHSAGCMVLNMTDCVFSGNTSGNSGGGLFWKSRRVRQDFSGNTVTPTATLTRCQFLNNTSTTALGGGVASYSKMAIIDCDFIGNKAYRGGGIAQRIDVDSSPSMGDGKSTDLTIDSATLIENNTADYGGGICVQANATSAIADTSTYGHTINFTLTGTTVRNNKASVYGGGICLWSVYETDAEQTEVTRFTKNFSIDSGVFYGNEAGCRGGGLYFRSIDNTTMELQNSQFYSNISGTIGKYWDTDANEGEGAWVTIGGNGGGIFMRGSSSDAVSITDCLIGAKREADGTLTPAGNVALDAYDEEAGEYVGGYGGGITINNGLNVIFDNTPVVHNSADYAGGGIYIGTASSVHLLRGFVDSNTACCGGGISLITATGNANATELYQQYGLYMEGGTISNNKVHFGVSEVAVGGGLHANSSKVRLDSVDVVDNKAVFKEDETDERSGTYFGSMMGGGIGVTGGTELVLNGGQLSRNKANIGGGAVIMTGATITMNPMTTAEGEVEKCLLDSNWAYTNGGGIFASKDGVNTLNITEGIISNNRGERGYGGALSMREGSILNLYNGDVFSNSIGLLVTTRPEMDEEGNVVTDEAGNIVYEEEGGYGAGVYSLGATVNIYGGHIHHNESARRGGGVYIEENSVVTITKGTFNGEEVVPRITNNTVRDYAGGIGVVGTEAKLILQDGLVKDNYAGLGGGGMYVSSRGIVEVLGGSIETNQTERFGGGIFANILGHIVIDGGTITQNQARSGGGIHVNAGSDVTVKSGVISYNTAGLNGGGIVAGASKESGGSNVWILGGQVIHNTAVQNGGGVYASGADNVTKELSSTVVIEGGLIDQNSAGTHGGGVYTTQICSVTINDGSITNNTASLYGAGIMCNLNSSVTLNGGIISGNIAGLGGGIGALGATKIHVNNGTIRENQAIARLNVAGTGIAYGYGGGICAGGNSEIIITGGIITENIAKLYKGAITDPETGETTEKKGGGNGGGIATLSGATVIVGSPQSEGETEETTEATESTTESTTEAVEAASEDTEETTEATEETTEAVLYGQIINNTADGHGGAIYASGEKVAVKDEEGNTVTDENGNTVYAVHRSDITVNAGRISNNIAKEGNGGGIYATGASGVTDGSAIMVINGGEISENKAENGNGGGIYSTVSAALTLNGGTICDNEAKSGGGICCTTSSSITIIGGSITRNIADPDATTGHGGGIQASGTSTIIMKGGYITLNQSRAGGGIYATYGATVTVDAGDISQNTAKNGGGGIYATAYDYLHSTVIINGGNISQNLVQDGNGGGIFTAGYAVNNTQLPEYSAHVTITGGQIFDNTATKVRADTGYGGGIYAAGASVVLLEDGLIYSNDAQSGGGVFASIDTDLTINNGEIYGHEVPGHGGGLFATSRSKVKINGGQIRNNVTTGGNGGGVYATSSSQLTIAGGRIHHNSTVAGGGGGIYATAASQVLITNGEISENEAPTHNGGGLYAYGSTSVTIRGGIISSNTANSYGGGVFITGDKDRTTGPTLTIENGEICNNSAQNGGGIFMSGESEAVSATVTISGGEIHDNTVHGAYGGGGLYTTQAVNLTISGGSIYSNQSDKNSAGGGGNGGGIYATGKSQITVNGGEIYGNTAETGGGGVYCTMNTTVTLNKGKIRNNTATTGNGGGLTATNYAHVTIDGGEISENTATYNASEKGLGGGIIISTYADVIVKSGSILNNKARAGGGIYATGHAPSENDDGATIKVTGGQISGNTASTGGGIYATGGTTVTVQGGEISKNTAKLNGGGIFMGIVDSTDSPNVHIIASGDTVGKVTENKASNGGGVFVGANGTLTVTGGHITNNQAVIPNTVKESSLPKSAKGQYDSMYGVGGGICVAGTSSKSATFILDGGDMAIYGNLADFSGDDVFSNGLNSQLTIPLVSEMNLSGFEFDAVGWFEDYNKNDTNYTLGLNMMEHHDVEQDKRIVQRYRSTLSTDRQVIEEAYVNGVGAQEGAVCVNTPGAYVAMTLGIPAAVSDTVVIDYGHSVDINLLQNDMFIEKELFNETGVLGEVMPEGIAGANGIFYSKNALAEDFALEWTEKDGASYIQLKYGKASWKGSDGTQVAAEGTDDKSGILNYVMTDMNMDEDEVFCYAVKRNDYYYYAQVTIVPATSIYYEDNGGFIEYTNDGTATWTPDGTPETGKIQGQDRPGASMREDLDADNIYGYDESYATTKTYSMGSAMKTTVSSGNRSYAVFTFTGTGFDIISRCDSNTGLIMVSIYEGEYTSAQLAAANAPTPIENLLVDSWYESSETLYQVPLIKKSGLTYGTYTVRIRVAYSSWSGHGQNGGNKSWNFYLDGIRIYDPAGVGGAASDAAQDAYLADNECWPVYQELRNMFLTQNDLTKERLEGTIFIDGMDDPSVVHYQRYGPNNEIYLASGQTLAFTLDALHYTGGYTSAAFDENLVAAIHIGMRGLTGIGNVTIQAEGSDTLITDLSTTDMYYDITSMMNKVVTITNTGGSDIAISAVKVTHTEKPEDVSPNSIFTMSLPSSETALAMVASLNSVQETPVITPKYPSLSFEGMVCCNIFFDVENLGSLTTEDMGLLTFATADEEGTVDTAAEVIPGAQPDGELYMVSSNGIPAKNLGDTMYFKLYVRLADGSYVYSNLFSYSAVQYAKNTLAGSSDQKLKALVVAMLNYGAEAQTFFGYRTDDLINKDLTAEDLALLDGYSVDTLKGITPVDASKAGSFAATGGFSKMYPTISFEGAFKINYFFEPEQPVDGEMTFYYWNEDTYSSVTELTADNADGTVTMTAEDGIYTAVSGQIVAKEMDQTVYAAAVYESGGETYSTGVLAYSVAAYCKNTGADQTLAHAAAIYSCTAKDLFGV